MKTLLVLIFLILVLCTTVVNAQTEEVDKAKAQIAPLFKQNCYVHYWDGEKNIYSTTKHVFVFSDRIEFRYKKENVVYYFANFCDYSIKVSLGSIDDVSIVFVTIEDLGLSLRGGLKLKQQADNLIFIRNYYCNKTYSSQLLLFEAIAANYRALKEKPSISEDQRKCIVQANAFSHAKTYDKAIEMYNKAIKVDQIAYPAAYSNLALLSAQINKFDAAIYYMKKYLMLEPEASDARSSQDKIYEWEAQTAK